jgi:hypothetical protein
MEYEQFIVLYGFSDLACIPDLLLSNTGLFSESQNTYNQENNKPEKIN